MKLSVRDTTLPRLDKNQVDVNINELLTSCIQIEEFRTSRRNTIPQQIRFQLNPEILTKIEQARVKKIKLTLSKAKLAEIQYYALLHSPNEYTRANYVRHASEFSTIGRSHLTFSTNYLYCLNQQAKTLFRTSIDLSGAISQQIQQDLWQNQQLLERISQAHYWLIAEILAQLPLKQKPQKSWTLAGFSLFIASLMTTILWCFLTLNILSKLLFFCLFLIINFSLKRFIVKSIKQLIIHNLANHKFGKNVKMRQFSWKILRFIA